MIIYLATNNVNGKCYVGQTIRSLEARWKDHCRTKDDNYFHNAIRKYGSENFTVKVLDTAETEQELDLKEIYWIKKLNTLSPNGYNLREGGNVSGRGRFGIHNPKSRLIYRFNLDGSMIGAYYGMGDAVRNTGCKSSAIARSIKLKNRLTGGSIWMYATDFTPEYLAECVDTYPGHKWRSVVCVETGEIFPNMSEAAKQYNTYPCSISACCSGKLKTTGGFHWEYYEGRKQHGDTGTSHR